MMDHTGALTSDYAEIPDNEPQQLRRMISALRDEAIYSRAMTMQVLAEKSVLEAVIKDQEAQIEKYAELNAAKRELILEKYRAERVMKAEILALKYSLNFRDSELKAATVCLDMMQQKCDHLSRNGDRSNQPIRAIDDGEGFDAWSTPGALPRGIR